MIKFWTYKGIPKYNHQILNQINKTLKKGTYFLVMN